MSEIDQRQTEQKPTQEFAIITKAKDLVKHTFMMTSERRFPKKYRFMKHDMDLNAGRIITGEKSIEEVGEEAFQAVLALLSGKQTKNETLGYHSSIDIYTMGPVI